MPIFDLHDGETGRRPPFLFSGQSFQYRFKPSHDGKVVFCRAVWQSCHGLRAGGGEGLIRGPEAEQGDRPAGGRAGAQPVGARRRGVR